MPRSSKSGTVRSSRSTLLSRRTSFSGGRVSTSTAGSGRSRRAGHRLQSFRGLRRFFNNWLNAGPMPPHKFVKMKYTQTFALGVGAGGILGTQQKFNLNSIYDCDATGGGHQPSGFDQMAAFYHRYKVNGVRLKLHITDPSVDGIRVVYVVLNPSNTSESLTGDSRDAAAEVQQSGWFDINNSGKQTYTKTCYLPIWKVSGLTKLQFRADPDNYTGPVTGDPGSLVQFAVAIADLNQNGVGACTGTVELTYSVMFYQRKFLAQS